MHFHAILVSDVSPLFHVVSVRFLKIITQRVAYFVAKTARLTNFKSKYLSVPPIIITFAFVLYNMFANEAAVTDLINGCCISFR